MKPKFKKSRKEDGAWFVCGIYSHKAGDCHFKLPPTNVKKKKAKTNNVNDDGNF